MLINTGTLCFKDAMLYQEPNPENYRAPLREDNLQQEHGSLVQDYAINAIKDRMLLLTKDISGPEEKPKSNKNHLNQKMCCILPSSSLNTGKLSRRLSSRRGAFNLKKSVSI